MFAYIWPIGLIILSNTFYHICAKSLPSDMNPMASLTITYATGAVMALICYFLLYKDHNLIGEYAKTNWAPFVLGISIVGLEAGFLYAYKAGWQVNTAQIVSSSLLAVVLIFVGYCLYHETLTWNKVLGLIICMVGLVFVNYN